MVRVGFMIVIVIVIAELIGGHVSRLRRVQGRVASARCGKFCA